MFGYNLNLLACGRCFVSCGLKGSTSRSANRPFNLSGLMLCVVVYFVFYIAPVIVRVRVVTLIYPPVISIIPHLHMSFYTQPSSAGLMLGRRHRWWTNIKPTLVHNKHEMFTQCWLHVGPPSAMLGQHHANIDPMLT